MYFDRHLLESLVKIRKSFLLLGPRQTGKSTLIQLLKPSLTINLADEETFVDYLQNPGLVKSTTKPHRTVFIDEIQRIPSLLNSLQVLIDSDKRLQFLLTGSSARKLRRGQANLLPGRLLTFELGPLNLLELGEEFDINRALAVGLLPGIYAEKDDSIAKKTLRSYAATYLKEEIQAEALTKNLEGFSRFFSVALSRSGDLMDFSKLAKEASIERMSARRYYDILLDTLIATEVAPFTKSQKRRLVQHPTFYLFDVGVLNGCLNNFSASLDRMGTLFEHLVLQLIVSGAKSKDESIRVSRYRTDAGAEVDFLVERGSDLFAIEVKASRKVHAGDLRGLKSFKEFYGKKHQAFVIYLGANELEIEGIRVLPLLKGMRVFGFGA